MDQYLHTPLAVALLIAVGWTILFSFAAKPPVRGYRNLGILASYLLMLVSLFKVGPQITLTTWAIFGVFGGVIYVCWEILQRLRAAASEEKPAVSLRSLVDALLFWPIMIPEAIEYTLAELGLLKAASTTTPDGPTTPETPHDNGSSTE